MRVRKWPVVGVLLAVLWLFVRGVELAPRAVLGELLIGLAVGLPVAYVARQLYLPEFDLGRSLRALPRAVWYLGAFLRELLTANIDVAYRVLHPSMPIEPDVIELPLRIETDAAITTLANSISLTPGTLTMEHDPETNTLFVHGIVGRRRDTVVAPIRRWEDLLLVIYDEEGSPSDPPPERYHQRVPDGGTASPDGGAGDGDATPRTGTRDRPGGDGDER